jgi:hypothetical protein
MSDREFVAPALRWCPVHAVHEPEGTHPWALACETCGALVAAGLEVTHAHWHQVNDLGASHVHPWPVVG